MTYSELPPKKTTAERINETCDELCDTLKAKNSNYGDTANSAPYFVPWLEPDQAILIRMSDKVSRLRTLLTKEQDKVGESVRDTVKDLAGYCVLLLIELDKNEENRED